VVKTEPEPTSKRSRATSGEVSTAKRVVTCLQTKALEEGPTTDEDLLRGAGEVLDDNEVAANLYRRSNAFLRTLALGVIS
jgi:hypothetical protein